jgi:alpha-mannosidase
MSSQSAGRTVILEHFAHLDWDWTSRFTQYVDQTRPIYSAANELLQASDDPNYTYSTCEIAFLRDYAENFLPEFEQMIGTGRLIVVGGAITSPDNLLTAGECFFRTFLVGLQWMAGYSLDWNGMVWLPDDFGHDSQLPATLVAMGASGVGFARVPGDITGPNLTTARPQPVAALLLNQEADGNGGIDFWWQASDGSTIFAHWMPQAYWQGRDMTSSACIDTYLAQNGPASPSRYVHVPVGGDFMPPKAQLPSWAAEWKRGADDAMVRSFADYVQAVKGEVSDGKAALKTRTFHGTSPATSFLSNPYFLGFYASRMELKALHNATTRLLLQAEVLDAACAFLGGPKRADVVQGLLNAWNDLAPSTHHDYITGTAVDDVYTNEQLPRLQQVLSDAQSLLSSVVDTIVTNTGAGENVIIAFNTLGFPRTGMVRPPGGGDPVWITVPAMGWTVSGAILPLIPARVAFNVMTDDVVAMSNGIVSVTISRNVNWGISSFGPAYSAASILDGPGNVLSVWEDGGNLYTLGYECCDPSFSPASATQTAVGTPVCEHDGDLYAAVTVSLTLSLHGKDYPYTLKYSLTAGDPFVSISITGAAPTGHTPTSGTSVFVHFPFWGGPFDRMEHGTPNHWDWKEPATLGTGAYARVFEPTHNFVTAWAGDIPLGAIYHGGVPAWALDGSTLTGCILRNTPGSGCAPYFATGSDRGMHTITFALRIADGLEHAESGKVLREALSYNNPLFCAAAPAVAATLEKTASLASSDGALITVAKRGSENPDELYLRVYAPANTAQSVDLTVNAPFPSVRGATALERPLGEAEAAALALQTPAPGVIRFTASHALTTLCLT